MFAADEANCTGMYARSVGLLLVCDHWHDGGNDTGFSIHNGHDDETNYCLAAIKLDKRKQEPHWAVISCQRSNHSFVAHTRTHLYTSKSNSSCPSHSNNLRDTCPSSDEHLCERVFCVICCLRARPTAAADGPPVRISFHRAIIYSISFS